MPSITRTSDQENALARVTAELEELGVIDFLLTKSREGKAYCLSVADGKRPPKIQVPDAMKVKVEKIIVSRKAFLIKDATTTAKKWNIKFDDNEKALLGLDVELEEPEPTLFDSPDEPAVREEMPDEQDGPEASTAQSGSNSFADVDADDEDFFDDGSDFPEP